VSTRGGFEQEPSAANLRRAASLLLPRDGPRGVELLLMRRPERDNDFRSGACVFPGGVLDAADARCRRWCFGLDDATASRRLGLDDGGLDYFIAALRECFEEVGLLCVCAADGSAVELDAHAEALRDWRARLHRGQAQLADLCEQFDWRLDLRDIAYFSHWLTPVTRPKRFDTRFFVRLAPPAQQATPDLGEALELLWLTPDEALDPRRGLKLLNVTQQTLKAMRGFDRAADAVRHAIELRGVTRIFPRPALGPDGARFILNGEPAYDEVARLDPHGRGNVRCTQASGDLVQLSPRLWRVCGRQRHAYLVSDSAGSEWALIDADADDAAQHAALDAAARPLRRRLASQRRDGGETALRIGADCHLQRLPATDGWLLVEERTLIGAVAGAPGIDWCAGATGFLVRCPHR